jgi:hypothetical protein
MKVERSLKGNVIIKNSDGTIRHILPPNRSVEIKSGTIVAIGARHADPFALNIDVSTVTHMSGTLLDTPLTVDEFMTQLEGLLFSSSSTEEPLWIEKSGIYDAYAGNAAADGSTVLTFTKTIIVGTQATRLFYKTTVIGTAAFNTIWASVKEGSVTFVNIVEL